MPIDECTVSFNAYFHGFNSVVYQYIALPFLFLISSYFLRKYIHTSNTLFQRSMSRSLSFPHTHTHTPHTHTHTHRGPCCVPVGTGSVS